MNFIRPFARAASPLAPFLAVFLVSCQCQQVVIPPSDNAQPAVAMLAGIANKSDIVSNTPVNETVASTDTNVGLLAIAQDTSGGVSNVQILGDVDTFCVNGNLGQDIDATFFGQNPDNSKPGQQACTSRTTGLNFALNQVAVCNPGFSFVGVTGNFTATAANFSGISASTAVYSFSVGSAAQMSRRAAIPKAQNNCASPLKRIKGLTKAACSESSLPAQ